MSPSDLQVLLHYWYSPEEHERIEEPAVNNAINQFVKDEVFEYQEPRDGFTSGFRVTEKGNVWVEMILSTPQPVMRWLDPRERRQGE